MTTIIDSIIQENIDAPLRSIVGVSVLPGYMVHYANDLLSMNSGLSFPAVSFQPVSDGTTSQNGKKKLKNNRIMRLIGAIDATDRTQVNQKLNSLLHEVRQALAIDKYSEQTLASSIDFGNAIFNLPDSQDQYAFFELDITIIYIEAL